MKVKFFINNTLQLNLIDYNINDNEYMIINSDSHKINMRRWYGNCDKWFQKNNRRAFENRLP